MNPLTNVKNINKLNETELAKGTVNKKSWHDLYKESAWIFIGGLAYGMTEGDILCVFSQYGEIVNINLVRDKKTGKIKGFCFLCYANQKSTILAVDNLNGIKLCSRTIRVDHVANYKPPKDNEHDDEITKMLKSEGCAPKAIKTENSALMDRAAEKKKHKKHKKEKKKHKKRKRDQPDEEFSLAKVKKEKIDEGYSKYENTLNSSRKRESTDSENSDASSESDSCVSRKMKQESYKLDKSHPKSDERPSRLDKFILNKHDKHQIEHYKHKRRKESVSSDELDHSSKKRKSLYDRDHSNGLPLDKSSSKHQKYKDGNNSDSSSDECSERFKRDRRNATDKDRAVTNSGSRHLRQDSSSGNELESHLQKNNRTTTKDKEKHGRRDSTERLRNSYKDKRQSVERERNSYKDRKHSIERERRQHDSHDNYRDHRNRESPHTKDHHYNERRKYGDKYGHLDKDRVGKKEYGKHYSERRER